MADQQAFVNARILRKRDPARIVRSHDGLKMETFRQKTALSYSTCTRVPNLTKVATDSQSK